MDMLKAIVAFIFAIILSSLLESLCLRFMVSAVNTHFRLVEAKFVLLLSLGMQYVRTPVNTGTMFLLHFLLNRNITDILIQNVFKQGRHFMLNKDWSQ